MGKADTLDIQRITGEAAHRESLYSTSSQGAHEMQALVSSILGSMKAMNIQRRPVCLFTLDRNFIMAAVLSSLSGGHDLVIPHIIDERILKDVCTAVDTDLVLSEKPILISGGLKNIKPVRPVFEEGGFLMRREPRSTFCWLYSGGSTGKPVMWPKTPVNLFSEAVFLKNYFGITAGDIILAAVPPNHIYGLLFSVLVPYVSGARVIPSTPGFPGEIIEAASDSGATVFVASPMHYKALAHKIFAACKLRLAFSSGGFLDRSHSLAFSDNTGVAVEEVYGSTETGGIACRSRKRGEDAFITFPAVETQIRHERLCVKSGFLSPGLPLDSEGFFTTADRAKPSSEGFELFGRVDNVVKVGGNRVEIGAVEEKIRSLDLVKDVYVFQISSKSGRENELAALVVSESDIRDLKKSFRKKLTPIEMPRHIMKVAAIPHTTSGKRDRSLAALLIKG